MTIENLDTLENKITRLVDRFNLLLQEKEELTTQVEQLTEQVAEKEQEIERIRSEMVEKTKIEKDVQKYEQERALLKEKTMNILDKLDQLEGLIEKSDSSPVASAPTQASIPLEPTDDEEIKEVEETEDTDQ